MGGKKDDEHYKRAVNRPFYYGYSGRSKTFKPSVFRLVPVSLEYFPHSVNPEKNMRNGQHIAEG